MSSSEPAHSVARNVVAWTRSNAEYTNRQAHDAWSLEPRAPDEAVTHAYYDFVTADWARRWPAEEIWQARKQT
ncbi:MAG: hypothetical protein M3377_05365 [Actinomycetota bacterium]|nr:hypothetical protein [Actinomycetota bacterium]